VPVPIMLRREPDRLPVSWAIVLERLREAVASGELASAGAAAEPSPGFSSPRH
jgi:hypothetical protein